MATRSFSTASTNLRCNFSLSLSLDLLWHFREDDRLGLEEVPVQESKRRHTFADAVRDVMKGLSMQELITKLEPFLRKVVREEVEHGILTYIHSSPRPSLNQIEASVSRGWQLHFSSRLPHTLFTGKRIEGEGNTPVQIIIIDANSKRVVKTGALSSIKIEILALDGDFGSDEQENWTEKEFDACVIREREGKRPLVTGELVITLKDGIGYLGDISFTDNSSWIRSRTFRLGARVIRSTCHEERIREARSGAFIVKDHRVEFYKKHYPPSLGDEVWRLEKIGKDGAFHSRLASKGINTVQEFLRLWVTDPSSLRGILGRGMSNKTWDTILQHAVSCNLDEKHYIYYNAHQQAGLVLNSIYNVVGATFDCQSFQSLDNLTISQKILVDGLKQHAYTNLKDLVEIDQLLVGVSRSPIALPVEDVSCPGSSLDAKFPNFAITRQDQPTLQLGFNDPTIPRPYVLEDHAQVEDIAVMQGSHPMQLFSPIQRNSFKMKGSLVTYGNDGNEWVPSGSSGYVGQDMHLAGCDISHIQMQNWFPNTATWGQGHELLQVTGDETGIGFVSSLPDLSAPMTRVCRSNIRWFKLRAVIKWVISIRRDLATKRRAKLLQPGYSTSVINF